MSANSSNQKNYEEENKVKGEEILMRGAYFQYMKEKGCVPDATVEAKARHAEECELRLARIANGAEPGYEKPKHRCNCAPGGITTTQKNITALLKRAGRNVTVIDEMK